jgi:hypothetical protein
MREWLETIEAVDERVARTLAAGLYELQHERRFTSSTHSTTRRNAWKRSTAGAARASQPR